MSRLILLLIHFFFLMSCSGQNIFSGQGTLSNIAPENKTLRVKYLGGFKNDVVVLYVNNVKFDEQILYSRETTANTYNSVRLETTSDSVTLEVHYYRRNHGMSLEYNALWHDWEFNSDPAYYFPMKKISQTIDISKTPFVGISAECTKWEEDKCVDRKPLIEASEKKFILD